MTMATKSHSTVAGRMTRSTPKSSATFMSLPQRDTKKRKAFQAHIKPPSSPALSFSYSSAIMHPTTEAPYTVPPSTYDVASNDVALNDVPANDLHVAFSDVTSNDVASSSTPSAHKRRLIVDSDDEGQSDPGPSANDYEDHYDNLAELNLISQVLNSHPVGSMSPTIHADPEGHVATTAAVTAVAEPDAALIGADQDQHLDSTAFPAFITIKLHFRRGKPLSSLRSIKDWPSPTFILRKSDSYGVLMALVRQHLDDLKARKPENRSLVWPEPTPYVQPTSSANQQHYRPINAENYDVVLAAAWHAARRRLGAGADILVKMFVYLKDTSKSAPSLQHAIQEQPRIEEANRVNSVDSNVQDIPHAGLYHELRQIHVALALLATRIGSGPVQHEGGDQIVEAPQSNNTPYREAGHLDGVRTRVRARHATTPAPQHQHEMIRMKLFNDQWVNVMMDIGDLRRALGLPSSDQTGFSEHQLDPPTRAPLEPDHVIDLDHEETPRQR